MEGYLQLKTMFSAVRVYAILDRQQFTCYDRLECSKEKYKSSLNLHHSDENNVWNPPPDAYKKLLNPKSVRCTMSIKGGEVIKESTLFPHGLSISVNGKVIARLGCDDANICSEWYKSIVKAVKLHIEDLENSKRTESFKKILNLDEEKEENHEQEKKIDEEDKSEKSRGSSRRLNRNKIIRSYKRLTLQHHPDRGGDAAKFNQLYEAYESLLSLQEEQDLAMSCKCVEFEAVIEKGPGNIGLGLSVIDNKVSGRVIVQSVQPSIILRALSMEGDGEIRPGDAIIAIENDDCTNWPISRVRARLSNNRVEVGAYVHFTFERRLSTIDDESKPQKEHDVATPRTNEKENSSTAEDKPIPVPRAHADDAKSDRFPIIQETPTDKQESSQNNGPSNHSEDVYSPAMSYNGPISSSVRYPMSSSTADPHRAQDIGGERHMYRDDDDARDKDSVISETKSNSNSNYSEILIDDADDMPDISESPMVNDEGRGHWNDSSISEIQAVVNRSFIELSNKEDMSESARRYVSIADEDIVSQEERAARDVDDEIAFEAVVTANEEDDVKELDLVRRSYDILRDEYHDLSMRYQQMEQMLEEKYGDEDLGRMIISLQEKVHNLTQENITLSSAIQTGRYMHDNYHSRRNMMKDKPLTYSNRRLMSSSSRHHIAVAISSEAISGDLRSEGMELETSRWNEIDYLRKKYEEREQMAETLHDRLNMILMRNRLH